MSHFELIATIIAVGLIIAALARYREIYGVVPKLTVMGDGNGRAAYETQTAELGLSENTVKVHRRRIMEIMGALSLADFVRMSERLL